jgi:hypothetical protein
MAFPLVIGTFPITIDVAVACAKDPANQPLRAIVEKCTLQQLKALPDWTRAALAANAAVDATRGHVLAAIVGHQDVKDRTAAALSAAPAAATTAALAKITLGAAAKAGAAVLAAPSAGPVCVYGEAATFFSPSSPIPPPSKEMAKIVSMGASTEPVCVLTKTIFYGALEGELKLMGFTAVEEALVWGFTPVQPPPLPARALAQMGEDVVTFAKDRARSPIFAVYPADEPKATRVVEWIVECTTAMLRFALRAAPAYQNLRHAATLWLRHTLIEGRVLLLHEDHVASDISITTAVTSFVTQELAWRMQVKPPHAAAGGAGGHGGGGGGGGGSSGNSHGGGAQNNAKDRVKPERLTGVQLQAHLSSKPEETPYWATRENWNTPVPVNACLFHSPPKAGNKRPRYMCQGVRRCAYMLEEHGGRMMDKAVYEAQPMVRYLRRHSIKMPLVGESAEVANGGPYKG